MAAQKRPHKKVARREDAWANSAAGGKTSGRKKPEAKKTSSITEAVATLEGSGDDAGLALSLAGWDDQDTLYLTAISSERPDKFDAEMPSTLLLAQCGSARVAQPLYTRNTAPAATAATHPDIWSNNDKTNAGRRFFEIIRMQQFMVAYTNGADPTPLSVQVGNETREFATPDSEFLKVLGTWLFEVLFTGEVRRLYDAVQNRDERKRVSIIFTSMLPWLSDLPWEMVYDPGIENFLSLTNVRFLRNVLTPTPADRILRKPPVLRILVASAQALGASAISDEQEIQRIKDSFRDLIDKGLVKVDVIVRCTPEELHSCLRTTEGLAEYDVFHFIGHGYYDKKQGGLVEFEDENGAARHLTARELVSILRLRGIRIVFLNACETGTGFGNDGENMSRGANYNRGVAIELAREGVPAVVANQYSVVDKLASLFSLCFYECLAHGLNIADAMREARIAVSISDEAEPMDWAVPVLFARNPNATLCARRPYKISPLKPVSPVAPETLIRRMSRNPAQMKVVVWCTSPAISHAEKLGETLVMLNDVQPEFGFTLKRRRIPASVWKVSRKSGFMSAEGIVKPLEKMRGEAFNADVLFCITDLPLMDGKETALYYFNHKRVVLFSTWGFAPPLEADRFKAALTNHLALGLLDVLTDIPAGEDDDDPAHPIHTAGFYNDQRSLAHITGHLRITAAVDRVIQAQIRAGKLALEQAGKLTKSQSQKLGKARYKAIKTLLDFVHSES
ncbi:CHAT domain-containing protein [Prosthecobacter sp.]|uniref:CHAT domain-containing protein n=1 Tax=Prosthecobacter sp. TaxID=1965333 RepID=UPI00378318B7